jgi:hypothetical protein
MVNSVLVDLIDYERGVKASVVHRYKLELDVDLDGGMLVCSPPPPPLTNCTAHAMVGSLTSLRYHYIFCLFNKLA